MTRTSFVQERLKEILVDGTNANVVRDILVYFDRISKGFDVVNVDGGRKNFLSFNEVFAHIFERLNIDQALIREYPRLKSQKNITYHREKLAEIEDYLAYEQLCEGFASMDLSFASMDLS
jgi:hypothetical protein